MRTIEVGAERVLVVPEGEEVASLSYSGDCKLWFSAVAGAGVQPVCGPIYAAATNGTATVTIK